MKTNILIQYDGGGYSGCIWEWNYFYIDNHGMFHDIHSSGTGGIDNLQAGQELIENEGNSFSNKVYIYDLNNEQDIRAFSKETHAVHVSGVLQWFNDNNNIEFFAICSACKCGIDSCEDMVIEGKDLFCYECYGQGECLCCECYVGDTEIVQVNPDEHHGLEYICVDCKEYHDEQQAEQELEDLRWQAFCTGKPDIFSDELREIWI